MNSDTFEWCDDLGCEPDEHCSDCVDRQLGVKEVDGWEDEHAGVMDAMYAAYKDAE